MQNPFQGEDRVNLVRLLFFPFPLKDGRPSLSYEEDSPLLSARVREKSGFPSSPFSSQEDFSA